MWTRYILWIPDFLLLFSSDESEPSVRRSTTSVESVLLGLVFNSYISNLTLSKLHLTSECFFFRNFYRLGMELKLSNQSKCYL